MITLPHLKSDMRHFRNTSLRKHLTSYRRSSETLKIKYENVMYLHMQLHEPLFWNVNRP